MGRKRFCRIILVLLVLLLVAGARTYFARPVDAVGTVFQDGDNVSLAYVKACSDGQTEIVKTRRCDMKVNSKEFKAIQGLLAGCRFHNSLTSLFQSNLIEEPGSYISLTIGKHVIAISEQSQISVDGEIYRIADVGSPENLPLNKKILEVVNLH